MGESDRVRVPMPTIDQRTAFGVLTKPRVLEVAAALGLGLAGRLLKSELVDAIAASLRAPFPRILELLRRDELKAICRTAGIDDSGRVATTTGVLNKDAEVIVNAALAAMVESLRSGSRIEIRGFGSFGIHQRRARTARNPKTGAAVDVPAKRVCYFRPGKTLRQVSRPDSPSVASPSPRISPGSAS